MFLPFVFLIFAAQALAFHVKLPVRPKNCEDNPVKPEPIADLQQLRGEWHGLYYWYSIADKSSYQRLSSLLGQCPKIQIAKATAEDIEEQKAICQHSQVDFDFDKVEIIAQVAEHKVLIAKGDEYHLTLNFCSFVGRMQFLKVSDDVMLISTPEGGGMMNLMARNVPSDEEKNCIVDNIDGLDGYIGFPFC